MFNIWTCWILTSSVIYWCVLRQTIVRAIGEFSIEDILPSDYQHLNVPKNVSNETVSVGVRIARITLRTIDESEMTFTVSIEMWLYWSDHRLNYPASIEKSFTLLENKWMDQIWNPKIFFRNAVDGKLDNIITPSSLFWFSSQKKIYNLNRTVQDAYIRRIYARLFEMDSIRMHTYNLRVILKLICRMDLHHFPHDQQECGIQICSSTYVTSDLYLEWNFRNTTPELISLHQYDIKSLKWENFQAPLDGPLFISCLKVSVVMDRQIGYYIINVYVPTVLIVAMSMLTFWIPPDAVPARTTLGVTSLLTIITKQYQATMPNVSYIVALNVWLSSCIAFVFGSLLELAIVIVLNSNIVNPGTLRRQQKNMSPVVVLNSNGTWFQKNNWSLKKSGRKQEKSWPRRLDIFSRIFFPLGFAAFAVVYWNIYKWTYK